MLLSVQFTIKMRGAPKRRRANGKCFLSEVSQAAAACPMGAFIHIPKAKRKVCISHFFAVRFFMKITRCTMWPFMVYSLGETPCFTFPFFSLRFYGFSRSANCIVNPDAKRRVFIFSSFWRFCRLSLSSWSPS